MNATETHQARDGVQTFEFIDVNDPQSRSKARKFIARHARAIEREKHATQERLGQDRSPCSALTQAFSLYDAFVPPDFTLPSRASKDGQHGPPRDSQATSRDVDSIKAPNVTEAKLVWASSAGICANPAAQKTSLGAFGVLLSQLKEVDHHLLQCCE